MDTPWAWFARWMKEPRVDQCPECGNDMPAAPRRERTTYCSVQCADEANFRNAV